MGYDKRLPKDGGLRGFMYSFESRIRYSETDSEGRLTLGALLNYFQDCSTFQSEDLGLGLAYLKERHMVWVLSSWQIVVERYPKLCERVEVGTFPYEFKGFLGSRNFFLRTETGEYPAKANSLWSLLDTETGKPARPVAEMLDGYRLEERLEMDYAPRRISLPAQMEERDPLTVKKHHLDTNRHVNNGQYICMAMEYLPGDFRIRQMRAEYKKQAFLDTVLYPFVAEIEKGFTVSLRDGGGEVYVNAEFV